MRTYYIIKNKDTGMFIDIIKGIPFESDIPELVFLYEKRIEALRDAESIQDQGNYIVVTIDIRTKTYE